MHDPLGQQRQSRTSTNDIRIPDRSTALKTIDGSGRTDKDAARSIICFGLRDRIRKTYPS